MANSRFYQFLYSKDAMLTRISGSFVSAGAADPSTVTGKGVQGIHRRTTGLYYVELSENYNQLVGFDWWGQQAPGNVITVASMTKFAPYVINTVGTTNFATCGYYTEDFTVAAGGVFVNNATNGTVTGTGTVRPLTSTGVASIELLPCQTMLQNNTPGEGSLFILAIYDYAGALVDPTTSSTITVDMYLRNSTIAY